MFNYELHEYYEFQMRIEDASIRMVTNGMS